MLKHPYRDYYIYRGLTRNYGDNSSHSNNNNYDYRLAKPTYSGWFPIIMLFFLWVLSEIFGFDTGIIILFLGMCAIPLTLEVYSKHNKKLLDQRKRARAQYFKHRQLLKEQINKEQSKRIERLRQRMKQNMPDGSYKRNVFKD